MSYRHNFLVNVWVRLYVKKCCMGSLYYSVLFHIICLQETFLKQSDNISFRDYNMFNYICPDGQRTSGGTSVMVKSSIPHSQFDLNTNLQAVAVTVTLYYYAIDLSLCHPNICLDFDWSVCDDLHGSDHFPILINEIEPSDNEQNCQRNLKKANWEAFTQQRRFPMH